MLPPPITVRTVEKVQVMKTILLFIPILLFKIVAGTLLAVPIIAMMILLIISQKFKKICMILAIAVAVCTFVMLVQSYSDGSMDFASIINYAFFIALAVLIFFIPQLSLLISSGFAIVAGLLKGLIAKVHFVQKRTLIE